MTPPPEYPPTGGDIDHAVLARALDQAPTLLENLLWGWLLGYTSFAEYLCEAEITDLRGPGYLPSNERGSL